MQIFLHLAIFTSGVFKTVSEIFPFYVLVYIPSAIKGLRPFHYIVFLMGLLVIFGSSMDFLVKYIQIVIIYILYTSGKYVDIDKVYRLHSFLYWILCFSVVISINPGVQDVLFSITRSYASANDLLAYTGGVAGFSPEPSYMGSLLGALLLGIFGLRIKQNSIGKINIAFYIVNHLMILFLLKSIMAFLFSIPVLIVFLARQKRIISISVFSIIVGTSNFWLPKLDTLNRLDTVISEIGAMNARPDAELGSNRGYIFERFVDYTNKFGFLFTRNLSSDIEKAVGIADFVAILFAPFHILILVFFIFPFRIRSDLRLIYALSSLTLFFWTPTLLSFHALSLGAMRGKSKF